MRKQSDIIRELQERQKELQDRLNAAEAICQDLLSHLYNSEAQGRIKFDDYRINYTQEAIERREAEARAKQLRDNFNTAKADFRDMAEANFWTLVFLNEKQRQEKLDGVWSTITSGLVLPEDAKRPQHIVPELTVDQLINRRAELLDSINRANATQYNDTIEHCKQSKADFGLNMKRERDKQSDWAARFGRAYGEPSTSMWLIGEYADQSFDHRSLLGYRSKTSISESATVPWGPASVCGRCNSTSL